MDWAGCIYIFRNVYIYVKTVEEIEAMDLRESGGGERGGEGGLVQGKGCIEEREGRNAIIMF